MALTPVAVLMFRFNNPDALLTLLMVGAATATLRAVDATRRDAPPRALAPLGGMLVGLASSRRCCRPFSSSLHSRWCTCCSPRPRGASASATCWSPSAR